MDSCIKWVDPTQPIAQLYLNLHQNKTYKNYNHYQKCKIDLNVTHNSTIEAKAN